MLAALALGALAAHGCGGATPSYVTRERLENGLVVSLDGVGGYNWGPRWLRTGLDEAGVQTAIVIYDWSKGPTGLFVGDLVAKERNLAAAHDLARLVTNYAAAMPGRPITIIGHSGGAAVVVWALEVMPAGRQVDRAILLAPALARDYDLSPALKAVRTRMHVMYSYADVGLMGAGTAVFGTMDRQHTVSAGLTGFSLPPAPEDSAQYLKIRQVSWNLDLMKLGHMGGHMGWTSTRFAREYLAPILRGESDPGEPLLVAKPVDPADGGGTHAAKPAGQGVAP